VELAVPAGEGWVGDHAAPALADEGGAHEACGLVRREAEEDLGDGVLYQFRRRVRLGFGWGFFFDNIRICITGEGKRT
jgi:hypothetical protein